MSTEFDQEKYMLDPNRWVSTLPKKNIINSSSNFNKKYFLATIVFVVGLILVSVIKNETRNLEKQINNLQVSINVLEFDLHQATLDHEVIASPENISRLAKKYLEYEFSSYKKSQIKQLNQKVKISAMLEDKKNNMKSNEIKSRITKKINTTKTELKKLQELYSKPERLPGEIKIKVAKKIESKKRELEKLYSNPFGLVTSKKAHKWFGIQIVKIFLGIPVVPGK